MGRGVHRVRLRNAVPVILVGDIKVRDIEGHLCDTDLIAVTHGRGVYILDDLTPQQLGAAMRTDAMLFDNRLATNWVAWSKDGDRGQQLWAGRDPPEGALISFHSRHRHRRRRPSRLPIRAAQWCADSRDCRMTLA